MVVTGQATENRLIGLLINITGVFTMFAKKKKITDRTCSR